MTLKNISFKEVVF